MSRSNNINNNNKRVSIGDILRRQSLGFDNPSMSQTTPPPQQQQQTSHQTRSSGGVDTSLSSAPSSALPPVVTRNVSKNGPPPPPKSNSADTGGDDNGDEIPPAPPKRIHSIERSLSVQNDDAMTASDPHGNSLVPELPPKRRVTPSNSSSGESSVLLFLEFLLNNFQLAGIDYTGWLFFNFFLFVCR